MRRRSFMLAVALLALTAVVYAPARHHAFLGYDDDAYVTENPRVNAGFTRDGLVWAWTGVHHATWHPLTTLSHMLDCQLFGLNPGPHHLVNVALHLLNTLLLFGVLARMTAQPWQSAGVAGLFALHPVQVESVAWISERKDVLSTCFLLLTVWLYAGYVRRPGRGRYTAVLAAYGTALLSKPMVVTLPFVLLLLDYWPLRRRAGRHGVPWLLLEKLPLLILAAATSVVTFIVQRGAGSVVPLTVSPLVDRVANAPLAYARYLGHLLWPAGLTPFYPFETPLPGWGVVAASALLLAASAVVLHGARRRPYLLVGWLWYLGMLVPVIGLVRIGDHAMADRYTYVPSIGIFIIAAWGLTDLLGGRRHGLAAGGAAAVIVLAACSVVTSRQLAFWQDDLHLFQRAVAMRPDSLLAQMSLGAALLNQGRYSEALPHLAESLRLEPHSDRAHYNMGLMFAAQGQLDGARRHYVAALQSNPHHAQARFELGRVLAAQGDLDGAVAHYRAVIRHAADLGAASRGLAVTRNARFELAGAYARSGRMREAVAELDSLLREQPDWTPAEATLACWLATSDDAEIRDGARAVQLAARAARRTQSRDAGVLDCLAAAEAEAGRFPAAVEVATRALGIARANGQHALEQALAGRLVEYRAGRPVRVAAGRTDG